MWIVVLIGEELEWSDFHGPFRSRERAEAAAAKWTKAHPDDEPARVRPLRRAKQM